MVTTNPARALSLPAYGLWEGAHADLVVFAAPSEKDAIRLVALRRLVLRRGRVVARAEPAQTTVTWAGREEPVGFLKPVWTTT
jgi:cytosine deaminase